MYHQTFSALLSEVVLVVEVVLLDGYPTPLRVLGNNVNSVLEIEPITVGRTMITVFSVFSKDG